MEDFLRDIGIQIEGEYDSNGSYVVDIDDSDDFAKIYSLLNRSSQVEEIESSSLISLQDLSVSYRSEEYVISLTGDYINDIYRLTCTYV